MQGEYCLIAENITKIFPGTIALSKAKLQVRTGEVHALVGENGAGKSTLMNIISGVLSPDEGTITFQGTPVRFANPSEAQAAGVGFVHQELALCSHISVAENIYMGRYETGLLGFIKRKKLYADTAELLKPFKTSIRPENMVGSLNIADQQIVEIAKSLSLQCKLLILDEPTSSLSDTETEILFGIIRKLKSEGISVLYITHRIAEIFEVCDRVTILRDGCYINTFPVSDVTPRQIVEGMVGRELNDFYPAKSGKSGESLLEVRGLCRHSVFQDINFELRRGEILGLSGLVGSGRTEVARAICAIDKLDAGEIRFLGEPVRFKSYSDAIKKGLCYLTEDRKQQAGEMYGVKTIYAGAAEYDVNQAVTVFEQIIANKPAGIAVTCINPDAYVEPIKKAMEAGIPVVTFDADSPNSGRYSFLATGNKAAGAMAANYLASALGEKGDVALVTLPGQLNHEERTAGFVATIEANYGRCNNARRR